ncbi:MAG: DNA-directed RNA polymerase subunit K [Nitrososphaerales archaeon]
MSTKGKSSKKVVKEKEPKTQTAADKEKDASKGKKRSVTVSEVAEVTEPLEVLETEDVEVQKPPEEVSTDEITEELRELRPKGGKKIVIGPPRLTRFERARMIGARALQLSLGAPSLVPRSEGVRDSITMADAELMEKALPISLRRILPNGQYQDIPIRWLLEN